MSDPNDTPISETRQRAASQFTTGALAKRWTKHFAGAIVVAAMVAVVRHFWPDLSPSKADVLSRDNINRNMATFEAESKASTAGDETTAISRGTFDRCEWKVTTRGERVTYAHVTLVAAPSDLGR